MILAFSSSNGWEFAIFICGGTKNKVYATNPHTLEGLKASIGVKLTEFQKLN